MSFEEYINRIYDAANRYEMTVGEVKDLYHQWSVEFELSQISSFLEDISDTLDLIRKTR